ncbi:MAG: hypothetical protein HYX89_07410, partial [Chloroflexi bacterium]|nr:hypothetical protein [Chloroflexota bacterium]
QYDFQGKLVPSLALSYKWVDDKTLEYKLRRGVKFHSGEPFTAADVKFTFEKVMSPYAAKSGKDAYVKQVERVEVIDDFTVRFVLKQKYPVFPYAISNIDAPGAFLVQPKAYIEKNGNEYYSQHPVGTGPFKQGFCIFPRWLPIITTGC